MGDMSQSINFHYTRKDLLTLNRIAEDETVDADDRELAKKLSKSLEREKTEGEER